MNSKLLLIIICAVLAPFNSFSKKKIEFNRIINDQAFTQSTYADLYSMNDGEHYTILENGRKIVRYSFKTGLIVDVVFDIQTLDNSPIKLFSDYMFSMDETKILLTTDKQKLNRYSFTSEYYVWNNITKELKPLSEKGRQQVPDFSPDGERIAFVRDRNIFIKNLKFGTESQVTFDGKLNEITNGFPDWVNEEEFNLIKAFEWSPDSKFLAYLRYDETHVPTYSKTIYQGISSPSTESTDYQKINTTKYPKAGDVNSMVSVRIYEIKSKTSASADLGEETDFYIPRIQWTPDANDLAVLKLNRRQNQLDVLLTNPYTGDTRLFLTEKNKRYISEEFFDFFTFLPDNKHLILLSERDGYSHLYLYDRQGFEIKKLTEGEFDVTDFYGFDSKREIFYYQAAKKLPINREVYYTSLDGKKYGQLSSGNGTNSSTFSKGFNYFINTFSNIDTPTQITLHDRKGTQLRVLVDNSSLIEKIKNYAVGKKEFFRFPTSEGVLLDGWIIKPENFNPAEVYPLLLFTYGGPENQEVLNEWDINWFNYLAEEGILVACVDPRGSSSRGEDFKKSTYMQLGVFEAEDMIESAKYLGNLNYIDSSKIAIYGWSYGGYLSAMCMEKGPAIFKAGIAVSPVTDWRFYTSIYTERYMRTPLENPDGYKSASLLTNAANIDGDFLLIHGSADSNVHFQNTMEFVEKMIDGGVQFDLAVYPNRDHSITEVKSRLHLYTKMTNFLMDHLK